jgi:two-component sensor histidine kinase
LLYAFAVGEKGQIAIKAVNDLNNNLVLFISDDGKGLDSNFDIDKTKTLGLKLVKNLINQLRGELEIINDLGTNFKITLSLVKNNNLHQ